MITFIIDPLNEKEKNELFLSTVQEKLRQIAFSMQGKFCTHFGVSKKNFEKYWAVYGKKLSIAGLFANAEGVPIIYMIRKKNMSAAKGVAVKDRIKPFVSSGFMTGNLSGYFMTKSKKSNSWLLAKYAPKQITWNPRTEEVPYEFFSKNIEV